MNKAIVTKPDDGTEFALFAVLLCFALSLRELKYISDKIGDTDWISVVFFIVFVSMAIYWAIQWLQRRKSHWNITWEGTRVRIFQNEYAVVYDGDLSDMHLVDQDGRSYYLYITPKIVFRLGKGQSSDEFESSLNKIQRA